jgi:hypothetical protein
VLQAVQLCVGLNGLRGEVRRDSVYGVGIDVDEGGGAGRFVGDDLWGSWCTLLKGC